MPRVIHKHPSKYEYSPTTIVPCKDFHLVRYVTEEGEEPFIKVQRIDALGVAVRTNPDDISDAWDNVPVGYMLRGGKFHVCNANMWYIGLIEIDAPLWAIHTLVLSELQMRTVRKVSKNKIEHTPIHVKDELGKWYEYIYEEIYPHHADNKARRRKR